MLLKRFVLKGRHRFIVVVTLVSILLFSGFITVDTLKSSFALNQPASDYLPRYKMKASDVKDIISGLPLDKRIIFQFVLQGDAKTPLDVVWYIAGGMDQHGEKREKHKLDTINVAQILFEPGKNYGLSNNYLKVADFKRYVRSLSDQNFDYLEFIPEITSGYEDEEAVKNGYVRFKIRAHYPVGMMYLDDDPGELTNPSPPFDPGQ